MIVTDLTFIEETVSYPWDWSVFKTQMEEQPQIAQVFRNRRHLTRRPNACVPCRKSKLRCDGKLPRCSACTKKRHKSHANLCVYPNPPPKRRAIGAESEDEVRQATPSGDDSTSDDGLEQPPHRGPPCVVEDDELFGPYSMAQSIDQFKSITTSKDSNLSFSSISQCSAREAFQTPFTSSVSIARIDDSVDVPEFMLPLCPFSLSETLAQSMPPYLKNLYDEAVRAQELIRMGKLMKAWVDMPKLVRLAQLARFDQSQGSRTPQPETLETEFRLRVWWFILDLDVQISMHIGKPLAVRVKLGIDQPTLDGIEGVYKDLEQSRLDFKRYALEVLGDICVYADQNGNQTYESLLEVTKLEQLRDLEKHLPQISYDGVDEQLLVAICDHKIELLALKMMLCCSLAKAAQKQQNDSSTSIFQKDLQGQSKTNPKKPARARRPNRDDDYADPTVILESARSILEAFKMVAKLENYDRYASWNRLLDVYCAVAFLAIGALRRIKQRSTDRELISRVSDMLSSISARNPDSHLATIAAARIRDLCSQILSSDEQEPKARRHAEYVSKPKRVRAKENSMTESVRDVSPRKRKSGEIEPLADREAKRRRASLASPDEEHQTIDNTSSNPAHAVSTQQDIPTSHTSTSALRTEEYFPGPLGMGSEGLPNTFESASTSFDNGMDMAHYSTYWGLNDPNYTNTGVPYSWYHPPLAHPQVPMLDFDEWGPPQSAVETESHMHQTISSFQSNMDSDQIAHFDQSAAVGGRNEQNYFSAQSMAAMSVPNTPHPASANRYFPNVQPSAQQDRPGDSIMANQNAPSATDENNAWDWVQRQRAMAGQVTSPPETVGYPYYSTFEIPPTSSAWS